MKIVTLLLLLSTLVGFNNPKKTTDNEKLIYNPCRLIEHSETQTITLDTVSSSYNALYARIGKSILCVHKCGSLYVFKDSSTTSTLRPVYFANNCFEQFSLAQNAVAVNNEYVFILSNLSSHPSNQKAKLLLVKLIDTKVKTIDKGRIDSDIYYWAGPKTLFYTKKGASMRCSLYRQVREKIGF